ncbi:hypothetical protein [Geoalkalibacter subterraneus]|uniref:General secretion pathway protein B n=1 Tax=Geoalkalibacter subterraneus TaxID=483547 RepID=A0A0B5FSR9_9BACT|nr:hypothetical protein [Geoalkalibacter subterraneus]AJF06641.1 hypothetical protein GSUB_08920 [Geoalkalibacter subterraneus]
MSSILKALKKLEEQKSEKKEGAVNIARDILRTSRNAKKAENWILPTAVVALLLTGAMVAYFLVGGFSPDSESEFVLPVAEVEKEATPAEVTGPSQVETEEGQNAAAAGEEMVAETEASAPPSEARAPVVDRPEAVFAGKSQPESSAAGKQESETPLSDGAVAATQNAGASAARVAADEETIRHQKETAATLKETAQVLKATAESLREKAEQARQAAVAARAAEQSVASGGGSRAAASVTTVRLSSASDTSEGTEPPTRHVYRPSDSGAAGGSAKAALSKGEAADQEESLPRVLTSNMESGKSRWTTASAAGAFPELKVSEIHYQYDVENRLAVVNDLPVMEGTVIDGARVDRILKDRVRFIFNGQYKEIRVSR